MWPIDMWPIELVAHRDTFVILVKLMSIWMLLLIVEQKPIAHHYKE